MQSRRCDFFVGRIIAPPAITPRLLRMDITDNSPGYPLDQPPPARLGTFVDIAQWQAERIPSTTAFIFLTPATGDFEAIDYQHLDRRIRAVAVALTENGHPGQRVMIVQQPGIEYITSLFACMYAGMVAVPVYPLDVFRLRHTLPRLQAITRDADAPIMLTSGISTGQDNNDGQSQESDSKRGPLWELCNQAVIFTDQIDLSLAENHRQRKIGGKDLAILQYTSGTTDTPRGVALRHDHLLANAQQIYREYHVPDAVCVFWLPPYHDMGLVGGLLLPMFAGRQSVLMSPTSFVQQPLAWLEAISKYRGTTTASPNFGYELCLRKITDESLDCLDLSSLRVAISGAEPIRATTMRRFSKRFAACGFRSTAFTPAYGMAEATLAITGKPREREPIANHFSASELHGRDHHATPADSAEAVQTVEIVSCGVPLDRTDLRIVDPDTLQACEDQTVGEIWVRGPSVADHYWGRPELSVATFEAEIIGNSEVASEEDRIAKEPKKFLRTGDLGFIYDGELYVSGRLKDLIIIAGRNFFAHEIEAAIQSAHEALKIDGGAAFSVTDIDSADERLVIVQEVLRPKKFAPAELIETIRITLAQQFELSPSSIVLVAAGSLSKTSSGKLQRGQCREQFLSNQLQVLTRWDGADRTESGKETGDANVSIASPKTESGDGKLPDGSLGSSPIASLVVDIWRDVLDINQADGAQHFLDVGGHSLAAIGLLSRIREQIGVEVDFDTLIAAPRLGQLIAKVEQLAETANLPTKQTVGSAPIAIDIPERLPLTATQQRFWILDQLDFRQAFLYVESALTIDGPIDLQRLASVIGDLPQDHDALRLRFDTDESASPFQVLVDHCEVDVRIHDIRTPAAISQSKIESKIADIQSSLVRSRFELKTGPLLRAALIRVQDTKTIIALAAHHIVCDGTSLAILANDIAERYNHSPSLGSSQRKSATDSKSKSQRSFVQAVLVETSSPGSLCDSLPVSPPGSLSSEDQPSSHNLNQTDSERGIAYWTQRLKDSPLDGRLAVAAPQQDPAHTFDRQQGRSQTCQATLTPELIALLHQRCRDWGVTPFEVILSAWHTTLIRYAQGDQIVLGVPVAGRKRSELESVVGCFINTLPIRLGGHSQATFADAIKRDAALWRNDLRHGDVPLDSIIQELAIPRTLDRLPLIQHLVLHQPPITKSLALGDAHCSDFSSRYSTLGAYDTALICQWRHAGPRASGELTSSLPSEVKALHDRCDLTLAHAPNLLSPELAAYLLEGFIDLLSTGLAAPDRIASTITVHGPQAQNLFAQICQGPAPTRHGSTVLDLFVQQRERTPDQTVLIDAEGSMTFQELDQDSTRLAQALQLSGVSHQSIVALQLNRSRRITIAALAVWKVGAAYLPLDPSYPKQRIDDILQDAMPSCILTDDEVIRLMTQSPAVDNAATLPHITPDHLAYLIYTSGSTGKPKGVMIGHDNLANVLQAFSIGYGVANRRRILAATTMSFDISILELFLPLVTGATSVIAEQSLSEDPDAVVALLADQSIDVVQATPSTIRMMLSAGWQPNEGLTVWCGGEPMQVDLATTLTAAGVILWNVYGPTETTVWSLTVRVSAPVAQPISIGRPIDFTSIRIVDANDRDCPIGVAGELWIGGAGVGRGYWKRDDLNRDRFAQSDRLGRMYRTGDLVRLLPCGKIEFLGRLDRQVKIRGHRVELGEIEAVLNRCPEVAQSAVALMEVGPSDQRLVAFYRPNDRTHLQTQTLADGTSENERLRERLADELPPHMIPAALIPLSEIPHTPAGKIDYKHLPLESCLTSLMLQGNSNDPVDGFVEPRTETEASIAKIWSEIFGLPHVSVNEHFFNLGGHSLMAAQMFARVRVRMGVHLPLREIYSHPTIAELAKLVDASDGTEQGANSRKPHLADGDSKAVADQDSLAGFIRRRSETDRELHPAAIDSAKQPLSPAEQRLWFVDQLEPNHPFYNLPLAAMVHGPLDVDVFWQSVQKCVARHEPLRSTYHVVDGTPIRRVLDTIALHPESIDLRGCENADEVLKKQIAAHSRRPFDLATGPLLRVIHWQLSEDRHAILVVMHHIISDGWSMSVMMRELAEFYRAATESTEPTLKPLGVTYRDYAAWQQEFLTRQRVEPTLAYWKQKLSGSIETLDLPTDFARPAEQTFEGATRPVELSGELSARLARIADHLNVTPFTVLLAAYGLLLSRLSGQRDLTVGTAVANRTEPIVEDLIGFFVNTVVVRQQSEGTETFARWVSMVHEVASEAIEHQEVAFEQVVAGLATQRDRSHSPLFQAAFVLQNTPDALVAAEGLTIVPLPVDNGTTKYDLTLFLAEVGGIFGGHFEYRTSLFRPETVDRFITGFKLLLQAGIESAESELGIAGPAHQAVQDQTPVTIDDLPLLPRELAQEIVCRNVHDIIERDWVATTVDEMFSQSVALHTDRPAIAHNGRQWTYRQLNDRVTSIACGLQASGVGRGERVLVYMPRSIDQVASLFAVMRCGAAFVPVDTQVPVNRVIQIASDLDPKYVICDESLPSNDRTALFSAASCITADELVRRDQGTWHNVWVAPDDLAYLIFTSGSTGAPKGVAIEHRSVCNFIRGFTRFLELNPTMRCAYLFSPSFDGALGDIFPPLSIGAAVEVIDPELALDPPRLAQCLTDRDVAMVALTPATLSMLDPTSLPKVQRLLSAGAALTGELAARWIHTHRLYNGYGPTECAIGASIQRLGETDLPVPSTGHPLPNTRIYVLDSKRRPVPDGVIGEVYIGGIGVARGYWHRDDLTAQSFMADPFIDSSNPWRLDTADSLPGAQSPSSGCNARARMYRTGDLGRWNRFGNLEIVGRCDQQIKLRGFRIEPGEISAVLEGLPGVRQSAVVAWGEDSDHGSLNENANGPTTENRSGAGKRLVAYIVPDEAIDHADDDSTRTDLATTNEQVAEQQHVENWRDLFDQSQRSSTVVFDPENDFSLWTSVITGRPIPTDEMRSWAEATATRIKNLQPENVLEIGCGTGLIFLRIGAAIESYYGIDVLQSAIDELRSTLASRPELIGKVTLDCRTADHLDDLPEAAFDTIVLNSVVQYFPSEAYLVRVLRAAQRLLAPGGRIFLGDLRNNRLHAPFAIAAELQRCIDQSISVGQFRARVRGRMEHDEELLVDPDLMSNLARHLERLCDVTTEIKTAIGDNELNRFRYDAVLWFDQPAPLPPQDHPLTVCNANVHREVVIDRMLATADDAQPLSQLLEEVDAMVLSAFKPSTIRVGAADAGWDLRIDWHPDCDDAVLVSALENGVVVDQRDVRRQLGLVEHELGASDRHSQPRVPRPLTNRPLNRRRTLHLIQAWKQELQSRLPAYMIPSAFVIVDHLPLTIQGKLDRSALPPPPTQRQSGSVSVVKPETPTQETVVQIWEELLEVHPIGIDDDFFELGGHSMLAVRMVSQVQQKTGKTLPLSALFRKPTARQIADLIDDSESGDNSLVVPLTLGGSGEPIFCVHPAGGTVFCYRELATFFAGKRPVFGIQARGLDGRQPPHNTLHEMAVDYADSIAAETPSGTIHLVGWSLGGNIAYEVARQLRHRGRRVGMLALLDSGMLAAEKELSEEDFLPLIAALFPGQQHDSLEELRQKTPGEQLAYFIDQAAKAGIVPDDDSMISTHVFDVFQANIKAVHDDHPSEYAGRVLLIRPGDQVRTSSLFDDQCLGWSKMVGAIELATVSGDHAHMLQQPAVGQLAEHIGQYLLRLDAEFQANESARITKGSSDSQGGSALSICDTKTDASASDGSAPRRSSRDFNTSGDASQTTIRNGI